MKKILLMEDEAPIRNVLKTFLDEAGFTVITAEDGVQGLSLFRNDVFDLVLLDIMMPKIDGYAVCEVIKKETDIPIIMLTALDDEESQVKGFDLLIDDYITKPFSMQLLPRRIEAVLRRYQKSEETTSVITYKNLTMDTESFDVTIDNEKVILTAREFEILKLFLENQGRVYTREQLLDIVWHYDYFGDEKIVNTHIKNIRKKLGADYIKTVRGAGYKVEKYD